MSIQKNIGKTHHHNFYTVNKSGERNTRLVILLTGVVMLVEIAAGLMTNSMALLADGWHMSTHLAALLITAIAYSISRNYSDDKRYTFGTGKVGVLGGYTSAVFLFIVAIAMAGESIHRFFDPLAIDFTWAIRVAVIGLIVNIFSAFMLKPDTHSHHHDRNLKAAYLHVVADAFTSVTAIVALYTGKYMGWVWMDPVMGIVGSIVICFWAVGLIKDTGSILLDFNPDDELYKKIKSTIESDDNCQITDLHIWRISEKHTSVLISLSTSTARDPEYYKSMLEPISEISHITIEVNTV